MFKYIIIIGCYVIATSSFEIPSEYIMNDEHVYSTPPDWKDIVTSLDHYKETAKSKEIKFSSLINLLKTLLADEIEKARCNIIEKNTLQKNESIVISCLEEQSVINCTSNDNIITSKEPTDEKGNLKELIAKITTALNQSKANQTKSEANADAPSTISNFKPKKKTKNDVRHSSQKKQKAKHSNRETFEKTTNVNPEPSTSEFQIPCLRTSDILDSAYLIPKETCENCGLIKNPADTNLRSSLEKAKQTTSVSCVESDDIIAMLFKPKSITLMQVFGNLLKKITITVLVPLYVSKLTSNS